MKAADFQRTFNEKLKEVLRSVRRPTIMVCGYTGVGKTSLLQAILGKRVVPDEAISHASPGTMTFILYQDEFISLIDTRGFEPAGDQAEYIRTAREEVSRRQRSDRIEDHIHLVWYCIAGASARVTPTDITLINEVFPTENTIVVITKGDITREKQKVEMIEKLRENEIPPEKVLVVSDEEGDEGRDLLVKKSLQVLPAAYHSAFIAKQQVDLDEKRRRSRQIIKSTARNAGLVGLVPLADIPVILPMQFLMIAKLSSNYGFDEEETKKIFGAAAMATVAGSLTATTLMDAIPIVGMIMGAVSAGIVTGGLGLLVDDYLYRCAAAVIDGDDVSKVGAMPEVSKADLESAMATFKKL